jgi:hypothetical protein
VFASRVAACGPIPARAGVGLSGTYVADGRRTDARPPAEFSYSRDASRDSPPSILVGGGRGVAVFNRALAHRDRWFRAARMRGVPGSEPRADARSTGSPGSQPEPESGCCRGITVAEPWRSGRAITEPLASRGRQPHPSPGCREPLPL